MSNQVRFPAAAASLAALMLLSAAPAGATQAAKQTAESAAKEADEAHHAAAGQKAAIDGAGRLRPVTAEEARSLTAGVARSVDQSSEGLTERYHQSGAVSIDLEDRFQSVSLARVSVDGSVATRCVTTVPEAERFLGQAERTPAGVTARASTTTAVTSAAREQRQAPPTAKTRLTTTPAPIEEK